ncbi:uncharacterized protein LOC132870382 isoform X2 [Neoarius graeffei]|uniref:uncharacterized protein LOC132870382 isoform X2 n=1 Tax=Neoarius graeffei TaxID=443677 RepID=UPI00298CE8C0|nr:uncharacterized protein LOC132870382 isoform X2 [Neoarius graeffei]
MLTLLNTFNMPHKLFLFCLFSLQSVACAMIVQYPAVVKVFRGEMVSLVCDLVELLTSCDSVIWFKVHLRTREMSLATAVHNDPRASPCTGLIYNTSMADSGVYYCTAKHSVISYLGNGSTVIITERHPRPIITLYVPAESVGPSIPLQCMVMGVVPSEVNVSWVVGESEMTGWTESGWTHTNDSVEYTLAHINIPSENWAETPNVDCVVEVDGRRVSKSLQQGSSQLCSWLMYLCSGVALVVVIVFVVTLVSLQQGRSCVPTRLTNSHFSRRNGGKKRPKRSSVLELQYASLDLTSNRQQGSNTLNRNVVLNE